METLREIAREAAAQRRHSPIVIFRGRRRLREEDLEPSSPEDLLESYRRRMKAAGIEPPREETHRGGNPAWNFLKKALNVINVPANVIASAVAELVSPEKYEGNVLTAMKEGFLNQRHVGFSDILSDVGVENKWAKFLGGLTLDVLTDPTTYVGVGLLTKAGKAAKTLPQVLKTAVSISDEIPEIGKATSGLLDALSRGADVASAASRLAQTAGKIAKDVPDKTMAKSLSNLEGTLKRVTQAGPSAGILAPTKAAQAAAGQRALLSFAGRPVIRGSAVFEHLPTFAGKARASKPGQYLGDIFDYAAPLRRLGLSNEDIERAVEARRTLGPRKQLAAEAEEEVIEEMYRGLPRELRHSSMFEQTKKEVPLEENLSNIPPGEPLRIDVEAMKKPYQPGLPKKELLGRKAYNEAMEKAAPNLRGDDAEKLLAEAKRASRAAAKKAGIEPSRPVLKFEAEDAIEGFRPDMTPEQRAVAKARSEKMREYLEKENLYGIPTKELWELTPSGKLELEIAERPTDYAYHVRTRQAREYANRAGDESVVKLFERAGFTKERKHRMTADAFNRQLREKTGIDFDWLETDIKEIDKIRAASHARAIEEVKILRDFEKIRDARGRSIVKHVGDGKVPEGMRRLQDHLQEWAVREEMLEFLERTAPKYTEEGIKTFTDLMEVPVSIWRGWAIATPGFIGRNALSNFWQLFLKDGVRGLDPRRVWLTAEWMRGKNLDAKVVTKAGEVLDGHTIIQEAKRRGMLDVGLAGAQVPGEKVEDVLGAVAEKTAPKSGGAIQAVNPFSQQFFVVSGIRKLNSLVEQHARTLGFFNDVMAGNTWEDAAINTKKFLFDYGRLTPKEKKLRTYIPFYTWTRKNLPLQVSQLVQQPGKYAAVGKAREAALASFTDEESRKYTPGYFEELYAFPTPFRVGSGQLWLNPDLPFQDLQALFRPKDVVGMVSPLLKAPVELGLDTETYFNRPIQGEPGRKVRTPALLRPLEHVPGISSLLGMDRIKDYYSADEGATISGMNPRAEYLFRQIPMLASLSRTLDVAAPPEKQLADILSGNVGVKFYQYTPEAERRRMAWENVSRYQDFMNLLARQYGIAIPSEKTIEQYLRHYSGAPWTRAQFRRYYPEQDYLQYLLGKSGLSYPLDLGELEAFEDALKAGLIEMPESFSARGSDPIRKYMRELRKARRKGMSLLEYMYR